MADTRTLRIVVTGDSADGRRAVQQTGREVDQTEKKVGRLRQAFSDLGPTVIASIAGIGILGGFQATIGAATELNETVSKAKTIFKDQYPVIQRWAENAETAMGQSTKAALDGAAAFANFFGQVGITGDKVAVMSKRFVELSSDFASFHNAQPAEVMDALLSATRGEYDALQRFVPTANAANIEVQALADTGKKAASQLTLAEKATALYNLVLKDGGEAVGDFGRTSDQAANQQRILTAKIQEQGAAIGQTLLPAYEGLLGAVNSVGPLYAAAGLASLIFGKQIQEGATTARTAMAGYIAQARAAAATSAAAGGKMAVLRSALSGVGAAAAASGRALSGMLAAVGGPFGIALAAGTLGLGYFIQKHQEAEQAEQAHKQQMMELTDAIKLNNGALDENVRRTAAKILYDNKALAQAEYLGFSTAELTDAYLTGGKALQDYLPKIDAYIAAQQEQLRTNTLQGEAAVLQAEKTRQNIMAAESLRNTLTTQSGVLRGLTAEQKAVNVALTGGVTANSDLAEATRNMGEPSKKLTQLLYDLGKNTGTAATKADDLKKAWDELTGAQQSQEEAMLDYEESADNFNETIDAAAAKVREAQKALKGKTGEDRKAAQAALDAAKADLKAAKDLDARNEAGRGARKAIADVAKASRDQMLADIAAGVPAAKALDAHRKRIKAHEDEAVKAGLSRKKVEELFRLYGKPPDDVELALKVVGDKETERKLVNRLIQQEALRKGISESAARSAYNKNKATGGEIIGPGTSTSDEAGVYALSNKEWVIQAESSEKYGRAAMDDLNQGRIPSELLKNWRSIGLDGRAGGGPIWNRRTRGTWPHPVNMANAWVPTAQQAEQAVGAMGGGNIMGWRALVNWAKAHSPGVGVYSTVRPGSRTLSGNLSMHAQGRAVDLEPRRSLAIAIRNAFGKNIHELITPWRDLMVYRGRPHRFSPAVERQHGVGNAGNDHIHWSMDNGGVMPPKSTALITNATNRHEYALTEDKLRKVAGIHIDNLNVTVQGNISTSDAQRIAKDIRNELVKVAGRNGGNAFLPSK